MKTKNEFDLKTVGDGCKSFGCTLMLLPIIILLIYMIFLLLGG